MWFRSLFNSLKFGCTGTPARSTGRRRPRRRSAARLLLEALEDRTLPSTFTVLNLNDSGAGSLRQAVLDANAQAGPNVINFAPGLNGTIVLTSGELDVTGNLTIDGPGASRLTVSGDHASRVFSISGSSSNVTIDNLTIADGLATNITAVGPFGNVTLGGGLLNSGAHVILSGVTLMDNQASAPQTGYVQTNLVSDLASENAQITDPNLKNPWGTSFGPDGSFSISDQKTNVSTLYSVTSAGVAAESPTVAIPTTAAGPQGPTGQAFNDTNSFLVNGTPATFIYADLNGTISAWNSSLGTTAQIEATTTGAAYTGLDLESTASGDFLYAANPKQGRIDVFDSSFHPVTLPAGAFVDPQLPAGLVPFSVDDINGDLYVMYAAAGPPAARNMAPEGSGAIAVYDTNGKFIKQLTSGGQLASPWGVVLAPSTFGQFGGDLLVGNFSYADPAINAFDPVSGAYLGTLSDSSGNKLLNNSQGIWDMSFGNGGNGGLPNTLYVATGLNAETDGLFAAIDALPTIATGGAVANVSGGTLEVSNSAFTDNQAVGAIRGSGGAIVNDASNLVLDSSAFAGNQATTLLGSVPTGGIQGNALSGAVYNAGGSQAKIADAIFKDNSAHGGNGANGTATAPNGGNAGTGVGGAVGNEAVSLLGAFAPSTMTVADSLFLDNQALGGTGGNGAAGGNGGNGSSGGLSVAGGAINNGSSTLTVTASTFIDNEALGGNGGNGGAGANGGAGSNGAGGAISSVPTPSFVTGAPPVSATLQVSDSLFLGNEAIGGAGGAGGSGGNGGAGGIGQGGGLRTSLTDWAVSGSVFVGNQAIGGAGGDQGSGGTGGAGGAGQGGALLFMNKSSGTVSDSALLLNAAIGGAGGLNGNGGNGQGGGVFNDPTSALTFLHSLVALNQADGGAAGAGGSEGQGIGGGVFDLGTLDFDVATLIALNHASTSNNNIFP